MLVVCLLYRLVVICLDLQEMKTQLCWVGRCVIWFVVFRLVRLKSDFSSSVGLVTMNSFGHPGDDLCIHSPIIPPPGPSMYTCIAVVRTVVVPCSLALRRFPGKFSSALDCGAGVGRITQGLLLDRVTDAVDLLEPCGHLLQERCGWCGYIWMVGSAFFCFFQAKKSHPF